MSESSRNFHRTSSWGTPESYWPFPRPIAEPEPEDRERFQALTPAQRIEWLVTMLRLLEIQFGGRVKPPRVLDAADLAGDQARP